MSRARRAARVSLAGLAVATGAALIVVSAISLAIVVIVNTI